MQVWETGYPGNECPAGAFGSDCAPLSLAVSGWSKASELGLDGRRCGLGRGPSVVWAVSEKWFHDLNSQNKFSRHKQNKILKCVQNYFSFCELAGQFMQHLSMFTLFAQFLCPLILQGEHRVCLRPATESRQSECPGGCVRRCSVSLFPDVYCDVALKYMHVRCA